MKKFLSLVLALVMTMSLVTVSAGATEYKDFTDKDEIQYAEAVTVLNKLGIITGYSEGDFRPQGELTRGAAAKIIVSLLIGPEAAEALGNETSPYPDVPAGNTFAGVISYCKTMKIISGYSDGTFRPQGTLTGYAFAKMLLGALGYDSTHEGFTGPGWNMNVAKLGGEANLFDRISFNGNATVNREQACQLALNTLKGTMVEYSGGMNITNGGQSIVVNPDRNYKTSNQEYATHINNKKATGKAEDDYFTVEFGEEHFVDLRMSKTETTAYDSFGRPSNEWSWKKVTIGTFPIEPDYVFTSQVAHKDATDAAKNRATGLGGFKLDNGLVTGHATTNVCLNGKYGELSITKVADIADYTDNGTVVEVYIDDDVADFIRDVVVIKSQLMEVRRVGSDYVALQKEDNKAADKPEAAAQAYNQERIDVVVENVQPEDADYATLSALKAGDRVVVTPVYDDASGKYEVGGAYVPETVSGALTAVDTYGVSGQGASSKKAAVGVTVGGTNYKISLWARDLYDVTSDEVKITRKDVTLTLDRYGYAMKAVDIGDTSDWFIIGSFYSTMVDNKIVTMAKGWDTNGNEMELNLGTATGVRNGFVPGDLVRYTNSTSNNADWSISGLQTALINTTDYDEIKTSDVYIPLEQDASWNDKGPYLKAGGESVTVDKGIKFIYVTFEADSNDVQSIDIKSGVQNAKQAELLKTSKGGTLKAQAGFSLNDDKNAANAVKVVVIKNESNEAIATNMMYIRTQDGGGIKDGNGNMIYRYTVDMMTPDGLEENTTIYSDDQLRENTFAAYTAKEHADFAPFYDLRAHNNFTGRTTSTAQATLAALNAGNKYLIRVMNFMPVLGSDTGLDGIMKVSMDPRDLLTQAKGGEAWTLDITNAEFVDLRSDAQLGRTNDEAVHSRDDFYQIAHDYLDKGTKDNELTTGEETWTLQMIINDNDSNSGFRRVAMVVITDQDTSPFTTYPIDFTPATSGGGDVEPPDTKSSAKDVVLTVNSSTGSWKNAEEDVRLTTTEAGAVTKITLAPSEGAKITGVRKSGSFTFTADDDTNTKLTVTTTKPDDGELLIVDVEAEDGSTARYTFLFNVYDPAKWTNQFVVELMEANGIATGSNGYTATDWTGTIGSDIKLNKTELVALILVTGVESEVAGQLKSAMEALGINVALDDVTTDGLGNWFMKSDKGGEYTWSEDDATGSLAWYKDDPKPNTAAKPVIFDLGTDGIDDVITKASGTKTAIVDDNGKPVPTADVGDDAEVGHTYTNKGWTEVTIVADRTESAADVLGSGTTTQGKYYYSFDVPDTIENGGTLVYYLKGGDTITLTLNLQSKDDIGSSKKDTVTVTATDCKVNGKTTSDTAEFTSASATLTKEFAIVAPEVGVADVTVAITGTNA